LPSATQVVGVHPHTFAVPPPWQDWGAVQVPQSSVPPQPSEIEPQFLPCAAHVVGVQPQTFAAPAPPHVCGEVQAGQLSKPPQPSDFCPQSPVWQVRGTHRLAPHWLGPAPPQFGVAVGHVPQSYVPPHPSGTDPHWADCALHDWGVHAHFPFWHVWLASPQVPQSSALPHPSFTVPHSTPSAGHVDGTQSH
jgi:hypothetical protein